MRKLTDRQQQALAEVRRRPMPFGREAVRLTVLRALKAKGLVELEYDERGDLVWRLVGQA